ncbi:MAG TPA: hypothetical protein VGI05_19920 [Streptosporangiaceae bacterium]|jgi:hypothetical protein
MAAVDRRVKLWAWLVRQQSSVGTKTEAEVIAMQSRHTPANGVTNRILGTVVPGTEVTNRAITGPAGDIPVRVYRPARTGSGGRPRIGAALALGNLFTVTMPFPIEKRAGSPIRTTAAGYTSYGIAGTFGNLFGVGLAVVPVIIAIVLTGHAPAAVRMPVLVLGAAGYGLVLAWIGVRIAARAAEQKLPELCQVAVRSKL